MRIRLLCLLCLTAFIGASGCATIKIYKMDEKPGMHPMMEHCMHRPPPPEMMAAANDALAAVRAAKAGNDVKMMKDALGKAEKVLEAREKMGCMCRKHMEMMEHKHTEMMGRDMECAMKKHVEEEMPK